jgi:cell division protein FtsB
MLPRRLSLPRRWRLRALIWGPATLIGAYFAYHALYGDVGYVAWQRLVVASDTAERELAAAQATNAALAVALEGLRPESLDPDAVETALRELGYVRPEEVVVLEPGDDERR